MKLPLLLPEELEYLGSAQDDEHLLEMLTGMPEEMIIFFEAASDDERWSFSHEGFMKKSMHWLTEQFLEDKLSKELASRASAAIQKHFRSLNPFLDKNIIFEVEGKEIAVNSLMWGTASEQLHNLIREHFTNRKVSVLSLDKFTLNEFHPIDEFIETGTVSKLWQLDKHEIMEILKRASEWDLFELTQMCEEILERYIEQGNVVDTMLLAHEEGWIHLKNRCITFINGLNLGAEFSIGEPNEISLILNNFRDSALLIFEATHTYITNLKINGSLGGEEKFSEIIFRCPKLKSLNLSDSEVFHEDFLSIPATLEELELSKCPWLDEDRLEKIFTGCPDLKKLNLSNNYHLEYGAWSELIRLKQLYKLNISYCHQVDDTLFDMILKAAPRLLHLIMVDCRGVSEKGLFDLGQNLPELTDLSVSQSKITDAALIELATRCSHLLHLDLSRCRALTESGIAACVQHAPSLLSLNISHCRISKAQVDRIKERHPFLSISF